MVRFLRAMIGHSKRSKLVAANTAIDVFANHGKTILLPPSEVSEWMRDLVAIFNYARSRREGLPHNSMEFKFLPAGYVVISKDRYYNVENSLAKYCHRFVDIPSGWIDLIPNASFGASLSRSAASSPQSPSLGPVSIVPVSPANSPIRLPNLPGVTVSETSRTRRCVTVSERHIRDTPGALDTLKELGACATAHQVPLDIIIQMELPVTSLNLQSNTVQLDRDLRQATREAFVHLRYTSPPDPHSNLPRPPSPARNIGEVTEEELEEQRQLVEQQLVAHVPDHLARASFAHLTSVVLRDIVHVKSFGDGAFMDVDTLQVLHLEHMPDLEYIGSHFASGCGSLMELQLVNLPKLEAISHGFGYRCTQLRRCVLEQLPFLEAIDAHFLARCSTLGEMTIENLPELRIIGSHCLAECRHLTKVQLRELPFLECIGDYFAASCCSIEGFTLEKLPELISVGRSFMYHCSRLRHVTISNLPNLRKISSRFCFGCRRLNSCELSGLPWLIAIRSYFLSHTALTSFVLTELPALEEIAEGAFSYCDHLEAIQLCNLPKLHYLSLLFAAKCSSLKKLSLLEVPKLQCIGSNFLADSRSLEAVTVTDPGLKASLVESLKDRERNTSGGVAAPPSSPSDAQLSQSSQHLHASTTSDGCERKLPMIVCVGYSAGKRRPRGESFGCFCW